MTPDPETLPLDAAIAFALNLMGEGAFRHLPLVNDEGRPVGMLSVKQIVQHLTEFFPRKFSICRHVLICSIPDRAKGPEVPSDATRVW